MCKTTRRDHPMSKPSRERCRCHATVPAPAAGLPPPVRLLPPSLPPLCRQSQLPLDYPVTTARLPKFPRNSTIPLPLLMAAFDLTFGSISRISPHNRTIETPALPSQPGTSWAHQGCSRNPIRRLTFGHVKQPSQGFPRPCMRSGISWKSG